ncbi:malate:quinone oxidoreductase [Agriterribacter humi]|uniref:malate:quinone oxidoreductase n=1 Tax=Agriterribacter humi TaxID=1104781 RepID=UPI00126472B9|nr:malate:quinone oxidoreductase [Agriterribacter humi]
MHKSHAGSNPDVVLIGAGIMSATLGVMLKELQPDLTIHVIERLDTVAAESSDAWNNAGTGHSAFCELNYTPQKDDGTIDCSKAIKIAAQFVQSREFWTYLIERGHIRNPADFIRSIPHMSFVQGEENVAYLKKRVRALTQYGLFKGMQYSEARDQLAEWIPLVMEGRDPLVKVAATRMDIGTDVNFGALTRKLFRYLFDFPSVKLHLAHEVNDLSQDASGLWKIKVKNLTTDKKRTITTPFVFIGAGGGSLPLLEKSDIPESKGYGGFPVSGQWLICNNPAVIERHHAKVYGKAAVGSPPMSVPHLDTRVIEGKKSLLFGPYAGFSTKFLKNGSLWDLPSSIKLSNIKPMVMAGIHNLPLTKYLIEQVSQSGEDRIEALQEYFPNAIAEDWDLEIAGQRVQVIKKDEEEGGVLEFGTEVVNAADGSISALLGASPGASTAVAIMIDLLHRCFADKMKTAEWQNKIQKMIPSYRQSLAENETFSKESRKRTAAALDLVNEKEAVANEL